MTKCRAEMRSEADVLYEVSLVEDYAWENQNRYWVVVRRMHDKKILVDKSTWSEKEAFKLWLEECEFLKESFNN